MGDIDEVADIQILADAVTTPGAAAHAQREVETAVEAPAVAERVRHVHQYACGVELLC